MRKITTVLLFVLVLTTCFGASAQKGNWNVSADLYNRYVWRGSDFGNSPVLQPTIEFSLGGFAIGAWGSYSTSANVGGTEADLYATYGFDCGLDLILTDYYFPAEPGTTGDYFDYNNFHFLEIGATKSFGSLSLSANYFMNGDNDLYLEAGYSFGAFEAFIGLGDKNYTSDGDFNVCNIGLSTSKDIKITNSFTLPLNGSIIINPEREQIFLVVGISL